MTKASIIIAEDEDGIRLSLEHGLIRRGYDVHAFPDGRKALDYLLTPKTPPQFLITDVEMPLLNGYGLLNGIASLYSFPAIIHSADDVDHARITYTGKIFICSKNDVWDSDKIEDIICAELGTRKFVFPKKFS